MELVLAPQHARERRDEHLALVLLLDAAFVQQAAAARRQQGGPGQQVEPRRRRRLGLPGRRRVARVVVEVHDEVLGLVAAAALLHLLGGPAAALAVEAAPVVAPAPRTCKQLRAGKDSTRFACWNQSLSIPLSQRITAWRLASHARRRHSR